MIEIVKRIFVITFRKIITLGNQSSLHGIHFLTESHRVFACRLFWILSLLGCGIAFLKILQGSIKSANEGALSFTVDTNHLNWQTVFPAVTICEKYIYPSVLKRLNKEFPDFMKSNDFTYRKMFADTSFGEGICDLCNSGCDKNVVNCSVDFSLLFETTKLPCDKLIHSCKWMDQELDCCLYFLPIDSDLGNCYSFNTLQSRLTGSVPLFKNNRTTGPGYLTFYFYEELMVYIHGTEEIPWKTTDIETAFEAAENIYFYFQIIEMMNDAELKNIEIESRKCRFYDEMLGNVFEKSFQVIVQQMLYSYSTCIIMCETEIIYKKCGCVTHVRDNIYKNMYCNYTGLGCVATYTEEKTKLSADESNKFCSHCLPSCQETHIKKVLFYRDLGDEEDDDDDEDSHIEIIMTNLPNIKYHRNVVRTTLDLVVSIGGLVGLFFGASLLSLVEVVYFFIFRN